MMAFLYRVKNSFPGIFFFCMNEHGVKFCAMAKTDFSLVVVDDAGTMQMPFESFERQTVVSDNV